LGKKIYSKFVPRILKDELIRAVIVKCFHGSATWWRSVTHLILLTLHQMAFFWSLKWKRSSSKEGFWLFRISWKNFTTELNASFLDAFSDRFAQGLEECKKYVALKRD
jgi:hypothetical protein